MEHNKDQIGAAVHGEAVAKLPSMKPDPLACIALAVSGALPDAQAADILSAAFAPKTVAAPAAGSEPTELIELLRSIRPNYGAVGSRDVDVTAMRKKIDAAITILSARAADAPSEPSELLRFSANGDLMQELENVLMENNWRGDLVERIRKSRAADALDSQPTDEAGLPPLPDPIEVGGEGWDFEDFQSEKTFSCEHMWAYARAAIASSQPTDGGVRNDSEPGREDEDWFFSPTDGN